MLTGDKTAGPAEGPHGNFVITGFSRKEGLEEAVTYSVTAKLCKYTAWISVAGT